MTHASPRNRSNGGGHAARRPGRRSERGAILLFTVIGMVTMLTFSALAIDIGMRNQLLARDQNAIDAATLAAAYKVATTGSPPDYEAASALVKEMIEQNLGIEPSGWIGCKDADHLSTFAASDVADGNECISFGLSASGEFVARVTLPIHSIDTIFGGVTGTKNLQLSASAGADGNECPPADPGCGGSAGTTTTTAPLTTTTYNEQIWCVEQIDEFNLVTKHWGTCGSYFPALDLNLWWTEFCVANESGVTHTFAGIGAGPDVDYTIWENEIYFNYFDQCMTYSDNAGDIANDRIPYPAAHCDDFSPTWAYNAAKTMWRHYEDCIPYWGPAYTTWLSTPTTTKAPTTTTVGSTTPPTTAPAPPTSIDINS